MKLKSLLIIAALLTTLSASAQKTLKVVVAGLTHDHVHGILNQYGKGTVDIIGIAEPNQKLWDKYSKLYNIPRSLFATDLKKLLSTKKPDAVLGYNAVALHIDLVEICAPLHIPVMVEKPLAATLDQAKRIKALADQYKIKVLTNYETTWYASYKEVYDLTAADSVGTIRKMVVHDGHRGPKEIGCSNEFLEWLTDPVLNGAGALNDFGCYGADLMTWLMKGQRPTAVTAIARHYKPNVYPKVEDDATILIEYPTATGQIEASWNWPFNIKDLEVFGSTGYLHAFDGTNLQVRLKENSSITKKSAPLAEPTNDPLKYLSAVLNGSLDESNDQASLQYNMIVMEILDAAKRSIKEGKRIEL
ncbi:Gfo/Idh/MocA family oxidoreductase [Mucilaginibacter limnophilus]|uniref:Gfo/Idh/MocA family oxidoreductase n=1 Tax=Mucilaginibacter limnophilus TaxID=1932778 RepID=A0A437MZM9_9SPHI|nr:Gfo/Idh/MocA family oxidoreductase [Mucilaginibacter limnophilus]RVU03117.1 Gfo/Idh/MocA family oxidoreductase [Mucilaginibacter limnophilus]